MKLEPLIQGYIQIGPYKTAGDCGNVGDETHRRARRLTVFKILRRNQIYPTSNGTDFHLAFRRNPNQAVMLARLLSTDCTYDRPGFQQFTEQKSAGVIYFMQ
ncbi:hypothetical protein BK675_17710 [Pseudomonas fluorescens]|nr:hypothetical protein DMX04_03030 [Pseudomonas koreensis]RON73834.1 hypothetical protein BK677_08980 [Pseudomonas fluorescens]ROO06335.1 hypothetical protein BK675_17710 [Pseudomonas fluorescens]ROO15937.1 hypothetical protein BK676_17480 [Pseudomonas fluorescens]